MIYIYSLINIKKNKTEKYWYQYIKRKTRDKNKNTRQIFFTITLKKKYNIYH